MRAVWFVAAVLCLALAPKPSFAATGAQENCYQEAVNGNWSAAVTDCTQAINQNAKDQSSYVNRCDAYLNLGDHTAALTDCNQAIALNPKNAVVFNNRCLSFVGPQLQRLVAIRQRGLKLADDGIVIHL
jgi:Flp pilus assembly protein TadD